MSTLLRLILISFFLFFAVMMVLRPRQMRAFGRRMRLVALIYVAVIVTSAAVRIIFGWGV